MRRDIVTLRAGSVLKDRSDTDLRASGSLKWTAADDDVLPAWVAEMDVAVAEPITAALHRAVDAGALGYGPEDARSAVPEAFAEFAAARWGWRPEPGNMVLAGDVVDGIARVLQTVGDEAGVVVPTPAYPPFLAVVPYAHRPLVPVGLDPDAPVATFDLDAIERELAGGARTFILCNPHNPWGRAFRREELESLRDVLERYDTLVIADEIHAPLVLPGATHVPYATVASPGAPMVTFTSATKGWNIPGVKCGLIVCQDAATAGRVRDHPMQPAHSSLGAAATRAAFAEGGPWLDALVRRLDANRSQFRAAVAEQLPRARMRPLEATYLALLDARAYGLAAPGATAREHGKVWVDDRHWGPGGEGFVRVNIGTSPERIDRIVTGLARAWER